MLKLKNSKLEFLRGLGNRTTLPFESEVPIKPNKNRNLAMESPKNLVLKSNLHPAIKLKDGYANSKIVYYGVTKGFSFHYPRRFRSEI